MLACQAVRRSLKHAAEPHIYDRGMDYYTNGRVGTWQVQHDIGDGIVRVKGEVDGSDIYDVALDFDSEEGDFKNIECSCPYGDVCKHAVALGLAFAASLAAQKGISEAKSAAKIETNVLAATAEVAIDEIRVRQALRRLGLSADAVPGDLIARLLDYREPPVKTAADASNLKPKSATPAGPKPFDPKQYFFTLNRYGGYVPTFHAKDDPRQQASIRKTLARSDLTSSQRELLTYIKEGGFGHFQSQRLDLAKLFSLLIASEFPVYRYYNGYNDCPLTIDLDPQPLRAEIVYEPMPLYDDAAKIKPDFFLRMPKAYWANRDGWYDSPLYASGPSVVHDTDRTIALHQMTLLLTGIIGRVGPVYDYGHSGRTVRQYQAGLAGEEIMRFEEIRADAMRHLELLQPAPTFTTKRSDVCRPSFAIDYDSAGQTLHIAPVIDYGFLRQNVAESVYVKRGAAGQTLARRGSFLESADAHIITIEGNVIRHAPVASEKEITLYRELAQCAADLGFTKTLKCLKRGNKPLAEYLRSSWPALTAYAQKHQFPVIFTKDRLALTRETFRAEFAADLRADTDWLYFDLACYCGDERMTLDKLSAFLESGDRFWRRDDGTLVEIANRDELERLARMLRHFEARENGFAGRLYQAPELEYVMTSSTHYDAARAKSFKAFLSEIEKGKPVKPVRLAAASVGVLRPYQKAGVDWLYFLRSYRFAGILADEMGLGKTLQALVVLARERVPGKPSIVACPKTLLYNWKIEAEKFAPELKVLVMEGTLPERAAMRQRLQKYDLVIISYSTLKQDESELCKSSMRFNYAILDEAQFIKNHATKNAQIAKKLPADYRLALTGTPIENNVSEIWSIFDFLMPGFLGNYEQFSEQYRKPIMDAGDSEALEHLRRKVAHFMLRRTKAEVATELPPKIEQSSQCRLSEAQNVLYQQILAKVRGEVFAAVEQKGFKSAQIHILAGLTKLRQACNHPALLIKDKDWRKYASAKLDMCMELAEEIADGGRKVLIFSQFTQMLDIVSAALKERGISHLYLSGKTKDRQSLIEKFNADPAVPVFLISLRAGGTGLNLTAADTVIIFDPWWNPSVENQAIDRAHRIGQKKTVNVYRLLTTGTIEEKIQALKSKKQHLFDALVGESGDMFKKLTWNDVRELFT